VKRLWHLPWLAGSFVLLCVAAVALTPFACPDGTGPLAVILLGALVLAHLLAAVLGLLKGAEQDMARQFLRSAGTTKATSAN
jgi:hypothetical protein